MPMLDAGPIAQRFLAPHPCALQIGSTVFVHGGILPQHARYGLDRINSETRAWMEGRAGNEMPSFLSGRDAVMTHSSLSWIGTLWRRYLCSSRPCLGQSSINSLGKCLQLHRPCINYQNSATPCRGESGAICKYMHNLMHGQCDFPSCQQLENAPCKAYRY